MSEAHPKPGEWVLIKDGIKEAFQNSYTGKWTLQHHNLIGKPVKVLSVTRQPLIPYIITCRSPDNIKSKIHFLEFPSTCVDKIRNDIPDGWYPHNMPPPPAERSPINVYLGLTKQHFPVLVSLIDGRWVQYLSSRVHKFSVNIIAYQPIANWPRKINKEKE